MFDEFVRRAYATGIKKAASLSCYDEKAGWIERFQGTPLFDSAMALAQEELHQEAQELQNRQTQQQFYSEGDRVRLQKKLLELELARLGMQESAPGPAEQVPEAAPAVAPPVMQDAPKTAAPVALLRQMAKEASIGGAALKLVTKNPGMAVGALGGAALGGIRGAQQKIDPVTGQPTGGGITGALGGAALGGAVGGAVGLGAQGAIRSAVGAKRVMSNYASKGLQAPGGFAGQLADQAMWRARSFGNDVRGVGSAVGQGISGAQNSISTARKDLAAHLGPAKPLVAPPAATEIASGT